MAQKEHEITADENRHHLNENVISAFTIGLLSVFGLSKSPFNKAVELIQKRKDNDALNEDFTIIHKDFNRIFRVEAKLLDAKKK